MEIGDFDEKHTTAAEATNGNNHCLLMTVKYT